MDTLLTRSSNIKSKSSATIHLRSVHGALQSVNKDLLCHFSPYYTAALTGPFAESTQQIFHVPLSGKQLSILITWLHTGLLSLQTWEREDRIKLYIFADFVDILALRRQIMTEKGRMERYREVNLVFSHLPTTSPLRRRVVEYYANHWIPEDDRYDAISALDITIHREFFREVVESENRDKAIGSSGCCCCSNVCYFHEHESEEEWFASTYLRFLVVNYKWLTGKSACGQLPKSRKPEKEYFTKGRY